MKRKILQIGDPILEGQSKEVDYKDPKIQKLIDDLIIICKEKADATAGISAPQVGESLRVCICRRTDLEDKSKNPIPDDKLWEIILNPIIKSTSKKTSTYWEGCLSVGIGPEGLFAPVTRPSTIEITYQDRQGNHKTLICAGFFSHVVQHEIDHLDGTLFLKYVDDPTTIWKNKDLDKYYEEHKDYPTV